MTRFSSRRFLALALVTAVVAVSASAQAAALDMAVSPSTLNLASNGGCVSIHAEIRYSAVERVELYVNGTEVSELTTFADDRGELVVRCDLDMIKAMVSEGLATFDLTAHTQDGTYTGTDTIRVINRGNPD
jgi:hypothetical protein